MKADNACPRKPQGLPILFEQFRQFCHERIPAMELGAMRLAANEPGREGCGRVAGLFGKGMTSARVVASP